MGTERIEKGMLARSKAGHDKDTYYVVWDADDGYVWLTDGRLKLIEKPKKKRKKHIQIVHAIPETLQEKLLLQKEIRNEDIKRAIKLFTRSGMNK